MKQKVLKGNLHSVEKQICRETNLKFYPLFYNHTIIIFISLRFESFNDKYSKIPYSHFIYLTRHIYMDHNSGDRNFGSTKIWGFFSEIPKFRTPN